MSEPSSANPDREGGGGAAPPVAPAPHPVAHAPGSPGKPRRRLGRLAAVVVLGAAAGFAAWYVFIREPEPRNDLERFRGDWQIAVAGRDTPNVVHIDGDRWESAAGGVGGRSYRVTLNEAATPREIDLDPVDTPKLVGPPPKLHGVYVFESRTKVRLRVAPGIQPRPKSLDDADAAEWVLTKVKLDPVPEPGK